VLRHGWVAEWFANGPLGLEQGFIVRAAPTEHRAAGLTVALAVAGNASLSIVCDGRSVVFEGADDALRYDGLAARDARGRRLPATFEMQGSRLLVRVRAVAARYPVTIDPFIERAKLSPPDAGGEFGWSVATDGDTIAVGANYVDGTRGAVYVFEKPRGGWEDTSRAAAKLTASDAAPGAFLGRSVAIVGDSIAAGAPDVFFEGQDGRGPGAVYVFVRPPGGWRNATEAAQLVAAGSSVNDSLGWALTASGRHDRRQRAARPLWRPAGVRIRTAGSRLEDGDRNGRAERIEP
jgi:FG-GAP repeat